MNPPNSLLLSMIAAIGLSFSASGALAGEPDTALLEKNKNKQAESRHHGDKSYPSQAMQHPYPLPVIRYPLPVTRYRYPFPDTRYPIPKDIALLMFAGLFPFLVSRRLIDRRD